MWYALIWCNRPCSIGYVWGRHICNTHQHHLPPMFDSSWEFHEWVLWFLGVPKEFYLSRRIYWVGIPQKGKGWYTGFIKLWGFYCIRGLYDSKNVWGSLDLRLTGLVWSGILQIPFYRSEEFWQKSYVGTNCKSTFTPSGTSWVRWDICCPIFRCILRPW